MDQTRHGLLRIGVFSQFSRISVRMLRHYQDRGLLTPVSVDRFTGYRFYAPQQLLEAALVVQLRDAGFPIDAIADVVAQRDDPASVHTTLEQHRRALTQERDALDGKLTALDRLTPTIQEYTAMTDVSIITLPAMTVAALRKTIPTYQDEKVLWEELMPTLMGAGPQLLEDGLCGATFHDPEYREADVDVEVWLQVAAALELPAPLTCQDVPEREVVTARLLGSYDQMPAIAAAIGAFIAEKGLKTASMFNIYRVTPAQNPDPNSWITDVCVPIAAS